MTRKDPVKEGESNWKRDKDNGDSDSNNFSDLDKEENPNQITRHLCFGEA